MKPLPKRAVLSWLTGAMALSVAMLSLFFFPFAVLAATDGESPLECLRCHTRALKDHDKLGSGSEACWACHDDKKIGILHLSDGTELTLKDSNPLCGDCHSERYEAWKKGTHGALGTNKGVDSSSRPRRPKCVGCHSPHQPRIELSGGFAGRLSAKSSPKDPSECLSCHVKILKGHDKLGPGSKACVACHYSTEMGVLHLRLSLRLPVPAGGERLKMSDYPRLCAECHQTRYDDWVSGTHGMPAWEEGVVNVHGAGRVGCIGCHDPHQPRVLFSNITLPHPPPQPKASPPPFSLLALFGTVFLLAIGAAVAMLKKGERL